MRSPTKEWIQQAQLDLKAAGLMLNDESLGSVSAFHAQQVVEKCLKALLEEKEMKIPRTHDLEKLSAQVLEGWGTDFDGDSLLILNSVYTESRYPSGFGLLPSGKPRIEEARLLLSFATEVMERTMSLLKEN